MSRPDDLLVIDGAGVKQALDGHERETIEIIRLAYEAHAQGKTSLPFSTFLRFPDQPRDRIIGLPAYVGDEAPVAGMKWVSSFPDNLSQNLARASAVLVLNDTTTGRPYSLLEGSLISAARTAASAALAAQLLPYGDTDELTLIGCGPINQTTARYIIAALPKITRIGLYDTDADRARGLAQTISKELGVTTNVHTELAEAISDKRLVSIATNASKPYIASPLSFADDALILHISLRDIDPAIILKAANVVDDIAHVNRESTGIELASKLCGNTDFIGTTIGDLALNPATKVSNGKQPIIYSPFGLGILDMKLGQYVYEQSVASKSGTTIPDFFPGNTGRTA